MMTTLWLTEQKTPYLFPLKLKKYILSSKPEILLCRSKILIISLLSGDGLDTERQKCNHFSKQIPP